MFPQDLGSAARLLCEVVQQYALEGRIGNRCASEAGAFWVAVDRLILRGAVDGLILCGLVSFFIVHQDIDYKSWRA